MNKKFVSVVASILCGVLVGGMFTGCGREQIGGDVDATKTQLAVGYYNGGLRDKWINNVIEDFEEEYADYPFESGKKGVQVQITPDKGLLGASLADKVANMQYEIIFTEDVTYYDFIAKGAMYDITDIVQSKASDKENKTIEEKMLWGTRDFFNVGTDEKPQYYALPGASCTMNFNYNIDLFEKKGFFFKKGASADDLTLEQIENNNLQDLFAGKYDEKSVGSDGIPDTDDDGLPVTFKDFYALLMQMKTSGVVPMIWSGAAIFYVIDLVNEIWANFEGADQMLLNYSWDGTAKGLIEVDGEGNITRIGDTVINADNAYKLHLQEGKLRALQFLETIINMNDGNCLYKHCFNGTLTHTEAQKRFIKGGYDGYQEIGILVDGTWWMPEGKDNFGKTENKYGERKFGILPNPRYSTDYAGADHKEVKTIINDSTVFINGNIKQEKVEVASAFMKYLHNEKSLNTFTAYTDCVRSFEYELSPESLDTMSYYGRYNWRLMTGEHTQVINCYPSTPQAVKNTSMLFRRSWSFASTTYGSNPATAIHDYHVTAIDLFNDIYNDYASTWSKKVVK